MSNFAAQLKTEISRIAKKESRAETLSLKKTNAQYRSEIAELKRRIASLEAAVKRLAKGQPKVAKTTETPDEKNALRFRADGFATLRKKLGLSGMEMAKLLGVSNQSVYHWESGKSKPRAAQLAAIAAARKLGKKEAAAKLAQV
jgi:DNA-binding transcriptional regulator YiaG